MSESEQGPTPQTTPKVEEIIPAIPKTLFTRAAVTRSVPVHIHFPGLMPDLAPFKFNLRLKLSADAEERREEYMALSATEQTVKNSEQQLDELCDLLTKLPSGFGDLESNGGTPGESFKSYVLGSDPATKDFLFNTVQGAMTLYWRKLSPHEFRPAV